MTLLFSRIVIVSELFILYLAEAYLVIFELVDLTKFVCGSLQ